MVSICNLAAFGIVASWLPDVASQTNGYSLFMSVSFSNPSGLRAKLPQ